MLRMGTSRPPFYFLKAFQIANATGVPLFLCSFVIQFTGDLVSASLGPNSIKEMAWLRDCPASTGCPSVTGTPPLMKSSGVVGSLRGFDNVRGPRDRLFVQ